MNTIQPSDSLIPGSTTGDPVTAGLFLLSAVPVIIAGTKQLKDKDKKK